jgi:hypothetical protein
MIRMSVPGNRTCIARRSESCSERAQEPAAALGLKMPPDSRVLRIVIAYTERPIFRVYSDDASECLPGRLRVAAESFTSRAIVSRAGRDNADGLWCGNTPGRFQEVQQMRGKQFPE